jgi:hypothetical protein
VTRPRTVNKGKDGEKEVYSVDLLLSKADADAQAFVKSLKAAFVEAHGTASRPGPNGLPFKTYLDDNGDETELWQFTFKRNTVTPRTLQELPPPAVQDAKGQPWPKEVLIGNGSTGKVGYTTWSWTNPEGGKGVSLNLEAVRVLHHVPFVMPDPGEAFGGPEEGYALTGKEAKSAPEKEESGPAWDDTEEIPF